MKQGSTLLKVVSIILIVFGALAAIMGILTIIGGGLVGIGTAGTENSSAGVALGSFVGVMGFIILIAGVVDILIGVVGVKASKENGQHTLAFVLGIIGVVLAAVSLIATLVTGGSAGADLGSSIWSGLLGLILPILYLVGVVQTRKGDPSEMYGYQQNWQDQNRR